MPNRRTRPPAPELPIPPDTSREVGRAGPSKTGTPPRWARGFSQPTRDPSGPRPRGAGCGKVSRPPPTSSRSTMTIDRQVLDVLELLAPHRQQLLLDTAVALLELQTKADARNNHNP